MYEYNQKFTCLRGKEFWNDGNLQFTKFPQPELSKYYKTCFGPSVSTSGRIFDDSNENVALAIRRLTGVKKPEIPGLDALMGQNQLKCFEEATDFLADLRRKYAPHFDSYSNLHEEAIEHFADKHDKRLLRINAMHNILDGDNTVSGNWVRRNRAIWKMKKGEWAKHMKKPRMIVDLGVEASLLGFRITNYLKIAQDSEPIHLNGGVIRFCKAPDMHALEDVFDNLINLKYKFYFVYFSDDACLSVRLKDGSVRFYNLDISSCDASHGPAVFDALIKIVPEHVQADMQKLISQCQCELQLCNRENPKEKVRVKPKVPMLYSGWTGTTAINNLANIMIAHEISKLDDFSVPEKIRDAALNAGYIITGWEKPLDSYTKLQFLKHSPVYDTNGHLRPMLNIGVLMRASGMCNYDLPGTNETPFVERAARFQRGLLAGAYPRCDFPLLRRMKETLGEGLAIEVDNFKHRVLENDTYPPYEVTNAEMFKRYDLSALEQEVLVETFGSCGVGDLYASPSMSKILTRDYDLSCSYLTLE